MADTTKVSKQGLFVISLLAIIGVSYVISILHKTGLPPETIKLYIYFIAFAIVMIFFFGMLPLIISLFSQRTAANTGSLSEQALSHSLIKNEADWDEAHFYLQFRWSLYPCPYHYFIKDGAGNVHFKTRRHWWRVFSIVDVNDQVKIWIRPNLFFLPSNYTVYDGNGKAIGILRYFFSSRWFNRWNMKVENTAGEIVGEIETLGANEWKRALFRSERRIFLEGRQIGTCHQSADYPTTVFSLNLIEDPMRKFDRRLALAAFVISLEPRRR